MSTSVIKDSLPELDRQTLDFIFDHVYDICGMPGESQAPEVGKLSDLLEILKALQGFNYRHRLDDACDLYPLVGGPLGLDCNCNSEGYFLWLAMLLAIDDLYELNDAGLTQAVHRISVRK
jgi:hypothetical protein